MIPVDALVKSGGIGGTSSSSMRFPCWWWQTEQESQANLECHLVFLNLTCSGKKWESWTWNQCWMKKHLQNDKLSPWFLFWGVCCFIQELGICLSWAGITNSSNKPTDPWYFMFAFSRQLLGFSLDKIAAYQGGCFFPTCRTAKSLGTFEVHFWLLIVTVRILFFQMLILFEELFSVVHASIQATVSLQKSTNYQKVLLWFPLFGFF